MSGLLDKFRSWLFAEDVEFLDYHDEEQEPDPLSRRRGRLIALPSRSGEIFIRRPQNQEEARICVDCLRGRRAVVLNIKDLQPGHGARVFDFLAGATYALGGQLEPVSDGVFLATPRNIGIMAEEAEASQPASSWQEI